MSDDEKMADVYAYGIVVWEMLAKRMCWHGLTNDEVEWQVREGHRPEFTEDELATVQSNVTSTLLFDVAVASWVQSANERPTFEVIRSGLQDLYDKLPRED